ncbi:MarR family transcriptional regulator [Streptomyces rhizosphaericus]|uniref:MarR family transcriptional regulator n=1 Tax=Streptomyces rhizosphaericus TaxID=114699 RepID=A0A6G4ACN2_9ACTN|nr:MarR family transcriptional regulator [Streptomyces rhizosphaericus]NEW71075.1 MarR family transcriptional regulator [Streptomyces rhizosphaericus]
MPTTTNTTTTPNQPDPAQLTGATAAVWAALNNQPGTTSTTLAQAAGAGRSTTTKALRHFEQTGLAHRESAAPDGNGRPVNYWYPTPTPPPDRDTSTSPDTTDEPPTADNDIHEQSTEHHAHPAPAAESPASEDDASEHGDADEDGERGSASDPSQGVEDDDAPAPAPTPAFEPPTSEAASEDTKTEETQPTVNQSGHRIRLAPGALRQMVIGHLTAHPDEAFTATRISRIIEKSSGAIANALVTLTKQGIAEQVTEHPRTYRITTAATRGGEA